MLRIEIVYDGEGEVAVHQQEIGADVERLVKLIGDWQAVADEPCPHGHKCDVVKKMLCEITEIIGG